MQTLIGRLTADAQIRQTQDGREVVNFSLALNRKFKPKGSDIRKQVTTYVNCSYWVSTGITPYLKKGIIVATSGHIGLDTWTSADGEARAAITQYVESIDPFFSKSFDQTTSSHKSSDKKKGKASKSAATTATEMDDDLPF